MLLFNFRDWYWLLIRNGFLCWYLIELSWNLYLDFWELNSTNGFCCLRFLHVFFWFGGYSIFSVKMSGGTPVAGGFMRQRHSQGYASSGDDLEDDACSRLRPSMEPSPRIWSRVEIVENILWLVSAAFIVYFGDRNSNLIYLLCHDDRIRRYHTALFWIVDYFLSWLDRRGIFFMWLFYC